MKEEFKEGNAFAFQGVGIKYKGLADNFNEEEKEMLKQYSVIVKKELGLDIWGYLYNLSESEQDEVLCSWVAIYTCDCIIYNTYVKMGIKPDIFLGYSMGITTALVCGGTITFVNGLHLLECSYKYDKSNILEEQGMATIIGMDFQRVEKIISENKLTDFVDIGIENGEYCIIIAGIKESVKEVMRIAKEQGALRVKDLNTPVAFHTKYADLVIKEYLKYIKKIQFKDSKVPILSTLNQDIIQDSNSLKKELTSNLSSRMMWKNTIEKVSKLGIKNVFEVSLSDTITKSSRLISGECEFLTYKKLMKEGYNHGQPT